MTTSFSAAILVAVATTVTAFGACDAKTRPKVEAAEAAPGDEDRPQVEKTEENNGQTVKISQGHVLAIRLDTRPGTGAGWYIDERRPGDKQPASEEELPSSKDWNRFLEQMEDRPAKDDAAREKDGGKEKKTLRFLAKEVRTEPVRLKLDYKRPFGRQKAVKSYVLNVIILEYDAQSAK